jgi:hypothetical protein
MNPARSPREKPLASLSLDLDNEWSYMKTRGDPGWSSLPSYLDVIVPRMLAFMAERNLRLTVFIVGQDAAEPGNRAALEAITASGHEVGNHSFRHEPWLHLYTDDEIESEIARAEDAITAATGVRPTGFRGPGFSLSKATLEVLNRRGYRYDASTFPTFLGPLARAYYFLTAGLSAAERAQRKQLFGSFWEGLRPLSPYRWRLDGGTLLELPVTTMPVVKLPFHVSYLIYLAGVVSPGLARLYFRLALALCRLMRIEPSLLLHPLDFLGADDDLEPLRFFPGMTLPASTKLGWLDRFLADLGRHFTIVPMGRHVDVILARGDLPTRRPSLPGAPVGLGAGA